jgi:hypothetical protein
MKRYTARFVTVAAVKCRLAATGLIGRECQAAADAFKHVRHCHANLRKELIDDAGDKQRDLARAGSGWHEKLYSIARVNWDKDAT